MSPQFSRKDIEAQWRERLTNAKLRLDFAENYVRAVERDLHTAGVPSPDGSYAYRSALRAKNLALQYYNEVLRVFSNLVLYGKLPPNSTV